MTLMSAATRTPDLDTSHSVAAVFDVRQMLFIERRVERWPTGSGIEFMLRREKWQSTQTASVRSVLLVIEERSAEGRLRSVFQQNTVFLFAQILCESLARFV